LGLAYKELGKSEQAIDYYQQALAIARETRNRELEQIALNNLGFIHVGLENSAKVVEYYQQVLALARELQDRSAETSALAYLGDAYASLNDNQKAIEFAQQALVKAREIKNSRAEAIALDTLSRTYSSLGDANKTIELAQPALVIARQLKNNFLEGRAIAFLGDAYASLKENQKAIELAQQALVKAREIKNPQIEAIALDTLTRAYSSLEEPQKVLEFGQASLERARQIKNHFFEWRALVFLSEAHNFFGDSQQAFEFAQQSLALAREIKNPTFESGALILLSKIHWSQRDFQKTVEFAQQSLAIAREIKNRSLESIALSILSTAYWAQRDYQKAIEYSQQALVIFRELKDRTSELDTLHGLNINYFYLGDYQKVIELNQQVLALAQEIKNPDYEGIALVHLGLAYFAQGDSQKLIEFGQQALVVGRESKSPIAELFALFGLSVGYSNLGKNEKAIEFSQASLAIARTTKIKQTYATAEPFVLNILGSIYRKNGQKEQAINAYRESLTIDDNDFTSQVGLARVYRDLNMPTTAITYYKLAVGRIEQIRGKIHGLPQQLQESFLQAVQVDRDKTKNTDIYRELADLLLAQGRIGEAQQVLELLKVQELNDFVRGTRSPDKISDVELNPVETQIRDKYGSLITFGKKLTECEQSQDAKPCVQLPELQTQYNALTQKFDQEVQTIEKQVAERRLEQVATGTQDFIASAEKIVNAQPNTVLIYPLVLQDRVRLLWASKGGVLSSQVCDIGETELWKTISEFRDLLRTPQSDIASVKATGKKLYDCLVKPLEPELQKNNIQNLVFVPDRATNYIPMGALFDGEKFLIERYTVSSVLNAGLTDVSDRLPPNPQNTPVLALGLSEAKAGFRALPNVPLELEAIVRQKPNEAKGIYPGLEFLNQAFTLDALQNNLRDRKILHIATHGAFVPQNPKESYLLLGNGDKYAIYQIQFLRNLRDVHLVVLSACETALGGPDANGTEIAGISSYFLRDKAKAVMASLWLVNDGSTSLLMQQFYKNLSTDKQPITKAEALRQAQLSLLNKQVTAKDAPQRSDADVILSPKPGAQLPTRSASDFSHPYYWAPFILIGNSL
jgi:CHAT domain-containing protein